MNKMNKHQQLMTIMMEECGELIQRCSKMMRKYETIEEGKFKKGKFKG